jgi:hypothetical protein
VNSIMRATEPLTTKEFFALDVDEKLKIEHIDGALVTHTADPLTTDDFFAFGLDKKLKAELIGIPLRGDYQTHLGQVTLKIAGIDVPIDLEAIARYALGV